MIIWFYFAVVAAGIIGSMGMGGGTILIPALVFLGGMSQHTAQMYNLIVFIPLAVFSLAVHFKNKLIEFKPALFCALFAASAAVATSFFAQKIDGKILAKTLGAFLILLAVIQIFLLFKRKKRTTK